MVLSAAVGTAVAADSDGGKHADAASWLEPTADELAASAATCCSVCLEPVVQQRARFGLLEGCSHAFCLSCIRQWREQHASRPDVARSCPECRTPSHFVIPSSFVVAPERKPALVRGYLQRLRKLPCKHFNYGEGTCPFGSSCHYAHTDREGRPIVSLPRAAVGKAGSTVLPSYRLSDFLFPDEGLAAATSLLESIPLVDEESVVASELPRRRGDTGS